MTSIYVQTDIDWLKKFSDKDTRVLDKWIKIKIQILADMDWKKNNKAIGKEPIT